MAAPPPSYTDIPEVKILLLGDEEVGKSTFLSRLTLGAHSRTDSLPPYELPTLRDLDQPFIFNVTLYGRPYRILFFDTASPTSYTLLHPDFIIMAYDITRRSSLASLKTRWRPVVEGHFNYDESLPVMVLGLKRDLRREWDEKQKDSVMPQEAVGIASQMRVDMYAECSALTGELCREVLEDVAKTAARTTTSKGAKSEDGCVIL